MCPSEKMTNGSVNVCFYGLVDCLLHPGQVKYGVFMETEGDPDIRLDYHREQAENLPSEQVHRIQSFCNIDKFEAMEYARGVMFSRIGDTLCKTDVRDVTTLSDEEMTRVKMNCTNPKFCWSLKPQTRVPAGYSDELYLPTVLFCATTAPCLTHITQRVVVYALKTYAVPQTVIDTVKSKLQACFIDSQIRSVAWSKKTAEEQRLIFETHFYANVNLYLQETYGSRPDVDYQLRLMNPANSDVEAMKAQSIQCNYFNCSKQDASVDEANTDFTSLGLGGVDLFP